MEAVDPCACSTGSVDHGIALINIYPRLILSLLKPTCNNLGIFHATRFEISPSRASKQMTLESISLGHSAHGICFTSQKNLITMNSAAHMRSTDSVTSQHACYRPSANQRGQPCPRELQNVFNETHILQERLPLVGVVPKQAVIVHDVNQHTFDTHDDTAASARKYLNSSFSLSHPCKQ